MNPQIKLLSLLAIILSACAPSYEGVILGEISGNFDIEAHTCLNNGEEPGCSEENVPLPAISIPRISLYCQGNPLLKEGVDIVFGFENSVTDEKGEFPGFELRITESSGGCKAVAMGIGALDVVRVNEIDYCLADEGFAVSELQTLEDGASGHVVDVQVSYKKCEIHGLSLGLERGH